MENTKVVGECVLCHRPILANQSVIHEENGKYHGYCHLVRNLKNRLEALPKRRA